MNCKGSIFEIIYFILSKIMILHILTLDLFGHF